MGTITNIFSCKLQSATSNGNALDQEHEDKKPNDGYFQSRTFELLKNPAESICINSTQEFLDWYNSVDLEIYEHSDDVYRQYYDQLANRNKDCDKLINQIDLALKSLATLGSEYNFVSNKTSSLNLASEKLIAEQTQLNKIAEEIKRRLYYFTQVEQISQRLQSPVISVSSEIFLQTINRIDECLAYIKDNVSLSVSFYCHLNVNGN